MLLTEHVWPFKLSIQNCKPTLKHLFAKQAGPSDCNSTIYFHMILYYVYTYMIISDKLFFSQKYLQIMYETEESKIFFSKVIPVMKTRRQCLLLVIFPNTILWSFYTYCILCMTYIFFFFTYSSEFTFWLDKREIAWCLNWRSPMPKV